MISSGLQLNSGCNVHEKKPKHMNSAKQNTAKTSRYGVIFRVPQLCPRRCFVELPSMDKVKLQLVVNLHLNHVARWFHLASHSSYRVKVALTDMLRFAGFLIEDGEAVQSGVRWCIYWKTISDQTSRK